MRGEGGGSGEGVRGDREGGWIGVCGTGGEGCDKEMEGKGEGGAPEGAGMRGGDGEGFLLLLAEEGVKV